MQGNRLVFELILNIALLVLIANLLSKFRLIQNLILQERRSLRSQAFLSVVFGGMVVLSTYTGIDIGSYSLNTRVIGAMAAGLLGGPIVGLYASLIGAVYVFFLRLRPLPWRRHSRPCCSDFWEAVFTLIFSGESGNTRTYFFWRVLQRYATWCACLGSPCRFRWR